MKQENILGTENINKLILKFAVPTILSMLTTSLYNLVDQIFIGHAVGYMGNAAINAAFPINIIVMGLALWVGDGTATYIGINLGAGRREEADKAIAQSALLLFIISAAAVSLFYIFMKPMLYLAGCTDLLLPYAVEYTKYILLGVPFLIFSCGMNPGVRMDGNPRYAMIVIVSGCALNCVLDPLFIFGFDMGLAGAAVATVISQLFSMILVLSYFPRLKTFAFKRENVRLHGRLPLTVLKLGLSSLTLNCCQIVSVLINNNLLIYYGALSPLGAEAVFAAMGAVQKVTFLATNVTAGIGIGAQPIISFNYGARNFDRVRKCYFSAVRGAVVFSVAVVVLTRIFPEQIVSVFGDDNPGFVAFGIAVLQFWLPSIILSGVQDVSTSFFQSTGRPFLAMAIPVARRIALILPLSFIFPRYWGVISILWTAPVADTVVFVIILGLLRKAFREMRAE
jgi:putative MATE family efflux protein